MYTMQKEEELLKKRLIELSRIANNQGRTTFSDFLNLNELNILHTTPSQNLYTCYKSFGGYVTAERQVVAFISDVVCGDLNYPISILEIQALNLKYAEVLNHRDYLGAILNLGIDRTKIGDILVEDSKAIIFVQEMLCDFIINNLTKIKHTSISIKKQKFFNKDYEPSYEIIKGTVASIRLDSLISMVFTSSRSKLVPLIEGGKVFVNSKLITTNSYNVKENDLISVRGLGKFQYKEVLTNTKKGRLYISVLKYK